MDSTLILIVRDGACTQDKNTYEETKTKSAGGAYAGGGELWDYAVLF